MKIICPSHWLKNSIQNSYLNKYEILVCPNGVDTEIFKPVDKIDLRKKHGLPLNKKIVTFSSANMKDTNKGIPEIISAANEITSEDILFLGIGDGDISSKNIKTTGYVTDEKVLAEFFALGDIFCFASKAETFSLSVAYSLSCGVPVVGFDLPVLKEIVDADVGILTQTSYKDLQESIENLLKDTNKCESMGRLGRDKILKYFSIEIFYSNYHKIYEQQF